MYMSQEARSHRLMLVSLLISSNRTTFGDPGVSSTPVQMTQQSLEFLLHICEFLPYVSYVYSSQTHHISYHLVYDEKTNVPVAMSECSSSHIRVSESM
jgi:hypothetical protein